AWPDLLARDLTALLVQCRRGRTHLETGSAHHAHPTRSQAIRALSQFSNASALSGSPTLLLVLLAIPALWARTNQRLEAVNASPAAATRQQLPLVLQTPPRVFAILVTIWKATCAQRAKQTTTRARWQIRAALCVPDHRSLRQAPRT